MVTGTQEIVERIVGLERQLGVLRRELAGRWVSEDVPDADTEVLVVRVGQSRMAFGVGIIEEVVMVAALAHLPDAPAWIPGLLNLRGLTVPVLDVLARLERRHRRPELTEFIVVARIEGQPIGFLVQDILHLRRVPAGSLERPDRDLAFGPCVAGVARCDGATILVLSAATLLATSGLPEIASDDV
jgi:purine-binding chemotaxis protein CheW